MEEFRHPVIDRLTLNLFNNDVLTARDFRPVEDEGVYLTSAAFKTFLQLYERRLQEPQNGENQEEKGSLRDHLRGQILNLAKTLQHQAPYKPFKMRY